MLSMDLENKQNVTAIEKLFFFFYMSVFYGKLYIAFQMKVMHLINSFYKYAVFFIICICLLFTYNYQWDPIK